MDTPTITLGGARCDGSSSVEWRVQAGIHPYVTVLEMDRGEVADRLLTQSGALSLSAVVDGLAALRVQGVYVVGEAPSQDPYRMGVVLADQRIWWRRKHVIRRFNIRRRSGDRRRLDEDGQIPQQVAPVADDVTYAPWSLDSGAPWTPQRMAEVVLDDVIGAGGWAGREVLSTISGRWVDNVEVDDTGPNAIGRVLSYLPGLDIYVGTDGLPRVFNRLDMGGVKTLMDQMEADGAFQVVGTGWPEYVHLSRQRPSAVACLFSVEQEVRFDSIEASEATVAARSDDRYMLNVLPVPDPTLTVNGKTVVQGTWISVADAITAWNADKGGAAVKDISDAVIRQFWTTGLLDAYYTTLGTMSPSVNWAARIAAIRAHYRQTYRINRRWMDRIYSMKPYRVSILDPETGQFAPAGVYSYYCVYYGEKALLSGLSNQLLMVNVQGAAEPSAALADKQLAPAVLRILDDELGIVRVDYKTDLLGNWRQIIPGNVENVPTVHARQLNHPVTIGAARYRSGFGTTLSATHRTNVVFTVAPAAPNNTDQCHRELINPDDVRDKMPTGSEQYALGGTGPVWTLRIGPQLATARYGWHHARAAVIERSFGVGLNADQAGNREALKDLLLNPNEIRDLAESIAASLLVSLADHWEGTRTVPMYADAAPVGNIVHVTHMISPTGVATTTLGFAPNPPSVDFMALLPVSARRLFFREVQR